MNITPVPFPLHFASQPQPVQSVAKAQWIPAVKGYSNPAPQAFEPGKAGNSGTPAVRPGRTRGTTTQFGPITDPPRADVDLYA